MTQVLDYTPTAETLAEIAEFEKMKNSALEKIENSQDVSEYFGYIFHSMHWAEFIDKTKFPNKMKVLDIGFGNGESSLYLAHQGHDVYSLDPSPALCEILQSAAKKYNYSIKIFEGIAEHLDQISEGEFDVCIFHSSLHHCDDPIRALEMCRKKLKKGGLVYLINEPLLKFFRSKKWYFKMLQEDPVSMGHYGGNEHIYYYHEYRNMLKKAGFSSVTHMDHVKHLYPRDSIRDDIVRQIDGQYVNSNKKVLLKFFVLLILEKLSRSKGLGRLVFSLFTRLSLLPVSFKAQKI